MRPLKTLPIATGLQCVCHEDLWNVYMAALWSTTRAPYFEFFDGENSVYSNIWICAKKKNKQDILSVFSELKKHFQGIFDYLPDTLDCENISPCMSFNMFKFLVFFEPPAVLPDSDNVTIFLYKDFEMPGQQFTRAVQAAKHLDPHEFLVLDDNFLYLFDATKKTTA